MELVLYRYKKDYVELNLSYIVDSLDLCIYNNNYHTQPFSNILILPLI